MGKQKQGSTKQGGSKQKKKSDLRDWVKSLTIGILAVLTAGS